MKNLIPIRLVSEGGYVKLKIFFITILSIDAIILFRER